MSEGTTIRADQIEGLSDLIREQFRALMQEEVRSAPEDMEQLRRSPGGTLIRLEEQVKALRLEMEHRFDALKSEMDQRFDSLKSDMDRRFTLLQWAVGLMYPILLAILGKLFLVK